MAEGEGIFEEGLAKGATMKGGGGVVEGKETESAAFEEAAVDSADGEFGVEQPLEGGAAEGDEEARFDGGYLGYEIGMAGVNFGGEGGAVARGAALDEVGNEDPLALEAGVKKKFVQELARGANEGSGLEVFLLSWAFTDEHDLGIFGAFAGDGIGAVLPEGAFLASSDYVVEFLEKHRLPAGHWLSCR